MEMIQNVIAEGLPETIRRNQREKGVPVIGREQPTKEIGTVNMPNSLDIATEKSGDLSRIYIRIPAYCCQFFIHLRNFDALVKSLKSSIVSIIVEYNPDCQTSFDYIFGE
jgi:hypothetical protein